MGGPTELRQRLESEAGASAAAYDTYDTAALQIAVYITAGCGICLSVDLSLTLR